MKKSSLFVQYKYTLPLFALVAIIFVTLTSYTTSPIFQGWFENDGKVFLFVAKSIHEGYVPYRDIFDHKGPVLYFIESFGWALTKSEIGVYLLQIVNMFITLVFMFKAAWEFVSAKASFFITLAMLPFLTTTLFGGNYSEEWTLGFSAIAVMLTCRYINNLCAGQSENDIFSGFILGFAFGFNTLIRVNNCIIVAICVFFIVVSLIVHKRFKNLLFNALAFIGGALATAIAPVIYFWRMDALGDMLYGSLLFNLKYSDANKLINAHAATTIWETVFPLIIVATAVSVIALFKLKEKKERLLAYFLLCMTAWLFAMYLVTGVTYLHYLAFAWAMPLLMYTLIIRKQSFSFKLKSKEIFIKATAITLCFAMISVYYFNGAIDPSRESTKRIIKEAVSGQQYELEHLAQVLDETIPKDDANDVFCLASSFSAIYLYDKANLYPKNRYFIFYDFWKLIDSQVEKEITHMMQTDPPRWLLSKQNDWHDENILSIIENRYTQIYSECGYTLYKLNE